MTSVEVNLAQGGYVVVLVGTTGYVKEYEMNPQVKFIKCSEVPNGELGQHVPKETKAMILTEGIPQYHYMWATSYVRTHNLLYLVKKNNQAVYDTLKGFFVNGVTSASSEDVKDAFVKGKLTPLIPLINWNKSNAENGRELMKECHRRSIRTTIGSLTQFVALHRRKQDGVTAVPRSVRSQLDISVEMLDEAIKGLSDMRDYLIATVEENRSLREKVAKFKKLMDD